MNRNNKLCGTIRKTLPMYFILFLTIIPSLVYTQTAYYVDPAGGNDNNDGISLSHAFKSIFKARNAVRAVSRNMTKDIVIYLRGGTHTLDSTFTLSSTDGGTNGHSIIYQPYNCEKPIISGGVRIRNWTLHDAAKKIYKAVVDPSLRSRQLYVNGNRATRARTDNAHGWYEDGDGYACPSEVANWKNISDVEVVSYMVWKCHRGPIASVSGNHAKMAQPYWDNLHVQYGAPPVWIENAYELLDSDGEWYLDNSTSTLYYKPIPGENMETVETVVPKLETLINCSGVRDVEFRGLSFMHATWLGPGTPGGFPCLQGDARLVSLREEESEQIPANIVLDHCINIRINSCAFEHLGSTALHLSRGCKDNIIYNNSFTDISGSGISVGLLYDSLPDEQHVVRNNIVNNNLISKAAVEFQGSLGILVGYTDRTVLTHNEIRYLPYTAISMGWGWSNKETVAKNNEISYNLIDSVLTVLYDGGAIYTLSAQKGTEIHHNYIRDAINEHAALYADEGSSYMRWHHNVLNNIFRWINLWSLTSLNVTADFNYFDNSKNIFSGTNCVAENNVYVENNNWPQAAIDIMNNAGRKSVSNCDFTIPGIGEDSVLSVSLYPNPTSNKLRIRINKPLDENYTVQLYDIQGRLLKTVSGNSGQLQFEIYLNQFSSGLYLVRFRSGKHNLTYKIVKQ